jgi:uncharacterized protein involved in exopolysaccharide biosynthesis
MNRPKCYVVSSSEFSSGNIFVLRDLYAEYARLEAYTTKLGEQLAAMPARIAAAKEQIASIEAKLRPLI